MSVPLCNEERHGLLKCKETRHQWISAWMVAMETDIKLMSLCALLQNNEWATTEDASVGFCTLC